MEETGQSIPLPQSPDVIAVPSSRNFRAGSLVPSLVPTTTADPTSPIVPANSPFLATRLDLSSGLAHTSTNSLITIRAQCPLHTSLTTAGITRYTSDYVEELHDWASNYDAYDSKFGERYAFTI